MVTDNGNVDPGDPAPEPKRHGAGQAAAPEPGRHGAGQAAAPDESGPGEGRPLWKGFGGRRGTVVSRLLSMPLAREAMHPRPLAGVTSKVDRQVSYIDVANPSDNQGGDYTCELRATAAMMECVYRRGGQVIPHGMQIGVWALLEWLYVAGRYKPPFRGCFPEDAQALGGPMGLWPAGTEIVEPQDRAEEWAHMQVDSPLVDGFRVTDGWERINNGNGYFDPTVGLPEWHTAHAVCRLAMQGAGVDEWMIHADWQGPRHGWRGCHTMHRTGYLLTRYGQSWGVRLPPGAAAGYTDWRKLLVRAEDNGPMVGK